MSDPYLDQTELSARWRVSPRTLERWRWHGLGPPYLKIGQKVLYRRQDVEGFELACLQSEQATAPTDSQKKSLPFLKGSTASSHCDSNFSDCAA